MVTASLLALLLSSAAPTALPLTSTPATVQAVSAAHLADVEDQGIGRGLRNMLWGGVVGGIGVGILALTGATMVGITLGVGLTYIFAPVLALAFGGAVLGVAGLLSSVAILAGMTTLLGGLVWFTVNSLMVLLRLSPDYKPGPGTDYLPM
jgi:hypothetical protein